MELTINELLPVPGFSQLGPDAIDANDCVAACGKMKINSYNRAKEVTVHDLYKLAGGTGGGLFLYQIQNALRTLGLDTVFMDKLDEWQAFRILSEWKSITALIDYSFLVDAGFTQFKNFRMEHAVEVIGMGLKNIAFNDPYRDDGKFPTICPRDLFFRAWASNAFATGSTGLVAVVPIQDLSGSTPGIMLFKIKAMYNGQIINAIRIRKGASSATADMGLIYQKAGLTLQITEIVTNTLGEKWAKLASGIGYVFADYIERIG